VVWFVLLSPQWSSGGRKYERTMSSRGGMRRTTQSQERKLRRWTWPTFRVLVHTHSSSHWARIASEKWIILTVMIGLLKVYQRAEPATTAKWVASKVMQHKKWIKAGYVRWP
jgi:hypothetical protein